MIPRTHSVAEQCTLALLYDAAVTISGLPPQVQEQFLGLFFHALTVETHSDDILRVAQDVLVERLLCGKTGEFTVAP